MTDTTPELTWALTHVERAIRCHPSYTGDPNRARKLAQAALSAALSALREPPEAMIGKIGCCG